MSLLSFFYGTFTVIDFYFTSRVLQNVLLMNPVLNMFINFALFHSELVQSDLDNLG